MIYRLEPINICDNMWSMTHITGFVVRANSKKEARKLAYENTCSSLVKGTPLTDKNWLDPKLVSCKLVHETGDDQIVLVNFSNP